MLQQKRMFKVLGMFPKTGGGTYWMRVGTGWLNRDNSINLKLDAMPKNFEFQIREMDEDDLRKRDAPDGAMPYGAARTTPALGAPAGAGASADVPF